MSQNRQPHILNASSNLLGICFILITGLRLTNAAANSLADEICIAAALGFILSCVFSYLSLNEDRQTIALEHMAEGFFLVSILALFTAVVLFTTSGLV